MAPQKFCELHVHIEGCVWDKHIENWWKKSEYLFPSISHYKRKTKNSFDLFLEQLRFGYNFLNSLEAYADLFNLYIEQAIKQNIYYAEVQINYALISTWNINFIELLRKVNNRNNSMLELRFIVDLPWQFNPSMLNQILENPKVYQALGVVGIGFGGDEKLAEPMAFVEIREKIADAGYKVLCHAGETTNYEFAKKIVDIIKPDRIAHGLSLIPEIVKSPEQFPPIDICLSSNIQMGLVENLNNHPINKLLKSEAIYTLSTDDPAIFNTNLLKEYQLASEIEDFEKYLDNIHKHWYKAAFDKNGLLKSTVVNGLYN